MAVWLLGKAFTFAYWLLQTLSRLPLIGFVFAAPIILVIVIVNTLVTTLVVAAMAIGTLVFMLNGGRPLDLDFEADAGPVFWKVIVYTFAALAVLDVTAASLSVLYHQIWIRVVFSDLLTWASSIHPLRLLGEVVETVVGWWRALTSPFSFALSNLFNLSDPQWVADVLSIEAICLCLRGHAARAEKPFREALALVTHLKNGKEEEAGIPVKPITPSEAFEWFDRAYVYGGGYRPMFSRVELAEMMQSRVAAWRIYSIAIGISALLYASVAVNVIFLRFWS